MQNIGANQLTIEVFSKIIKFVPEKVIIDSITFSRNEAYKEKNGILVLVSGTSVDRNSLISFSNSLEQSKDFTFVDVPVSSLTKDKNLPFSINIFIEN